LVETKFVFTVCYSTQSAKHKQITPGSAHITIWSFETNQNKWKELIQHNQNLTYYLVTHKHQETVKYAYFDANYTSNNLQAIFVKMIFCNWFCLVIMDMDWNPDFWQGL